MGLDWMMVCRFKLLRTGSNGVVRAYVHICIHTLHTYVHIYSYLGTYIHIQTDRRYPMYRISELRDFKKSEKKNKKNLKMHAEFSFTEMKA